MIFNVNFIIHSIFVTVMSAGFTVLDSAGVLLMIKEIVSANKSLGEILIIITASMWVINVIASLILFKKCFKTNTLIHYGKLIKKDPNIDIIVKE